MLHVEEHLGTVNHAELRIVRCRSK